MFATTLARPIVLSTQPAVARRQLADALAAADWRGDVNAVLLVVHEALVNALRHGGGVTRAAAGFDGGSLLVEVWDRGSGFRFPRSMPVPDASAEHGRGLFLMRRLATDARVVRSGDDVGLLLRFDPREDDGAGAERQPLC